MKRKKKRERKGGKGYAFDNVEHVAHVLLKMRRRVVMEAHKDPEHWLIVLIASILHCLILTRSHDEMPTRHDQRKIKKVLMENM